MAKVLDLIYRVRDEASASLRDIQTAQTGVIDTTKQLGTDAGAWADTIVSKSGPSVGALNQVQSAGRGLSSVLRAVGLDAEAAFVTTASQAVGAIPEIVALGGAIKGLSVSVGALLPGVGILAGIAAGTVAINNAAASKEGKEALTWYESLLATLMGMEGVDLLRSFKTEGRIPGYSHPGRRTAAEEAAGMYPGWFNNTPMAAIGVGGVVETQGLVPVLKDLTAYLRSERGGRGGGQPATGHGWWEDSGKWHPTTTYDQAVQGWMDYKGYTRVEGTVSITGTTEVKDSTTAGAINDLGRKIDNLPGRIAAALSRYLN